ncbi:MFS transporter [Rhizobium sp. BE258]|jgi:predicted MFS family arabinose efflux permease|uniref:MFS transporter n=1 Tax=Rhizobium sp. BE258 TaxID=2817722 RepID=UPI0028594EDB|nr:MFS transporter [Rhizobium sp. BE258]MDR7146425.1 putative MFS family arabinose efflux permease [Rhizobium sp. BE258]
MPTFPLRSAQTIAVLAITQLIGWGTTFDMLGVMGRVIAPELGLPNEIIFAGITIMMVVTAFASPSTGRLLARHGAAKVLAASSLIFATGLVMLSAAHDIVLYALAWIVIGLGGALGLSAPAYTAVVEREGMNGKRVIAILMLFTGLSATIFWPLLTWLNDAFGWRAAFRISAALHLFICLPLHLFALPKPVATHTQGTAAETPPIALSSKQRRAAFLLLAASTTLCTFVSFGVAPSLIEIFRQSGASPAFALQLGSARGVIGISARGLDMLLGKRGNPILTSIVGISLMLASFAMLLAFASTPVLVTFILMYGFGSGILAVARALLPLSFFSAKEYGLQAARLSMPQNLANAAAPVIFTATLDRSGTGLTLIICAVLAAIALALVLMLAAMVRQAARQPVPSLP